MNSKTYASSSFRTPAMPPRVKRQRVGKPPAAAMGMESVGHLNKAANEMINALSNSEDGAANQDVWPLVGGSTMTS